MKIFDVEYSVEVDNDYVVDELSVEACCFFSAVDAAISILENNLGLPEDGYDILKIELVRDNVYTPAETEDFEEEPAKPQLVN